MVCKKCGKEIAPGAKFCMECGTPVSSMVPVDMEEPVKQEIQPPRKNRFDDDYEDTEEEAGGHKALVVLGVLLAVAVIAGAGVFAYMYFNQSDKNSQKPAAVTETQTEIPVTEKNTEPVVNTETEKDTNVTGYNGKGNPTPVTAGNTDTEMAVQTVHSYQIVVADVTWQEAYDAALKVPKGHLVTIDSDDEMTTIANVIKQQGQTNKTFWIGARRADGSNDYHWIDSSGNPTGDSINTSKYWKSGEPSLHDTKLKADEQFVDMTFSSETNSWVWNDTVNNLVKALKEYKGKMAYIVEVE